MEAEGRKVALLVDGDNIPASLAGRLIVRAGGLGTLIVKRATVEPSHLPNWCGAQGFGLRAVRQSRDAADLLLAIEAVALAHRGDIGAFAIASGDGGFAPLALWLVERGLIVLGMGPATAPLDWRRCCTRFEELAPPGPAPAAGTKPAATAVPPSRPTTAVPPPRPATSPPPASAAAAR